MRAYNVKQRKIAYISGLVSGFIGVVLLLLINGVLRFSISFFYAIVPLSIDYGFTKFKGLKTEGYMTYISISSMVLMFIGMLVAKDFSVISFVINMLFLYFGIRHCENKM